MEEIFEKDTCQSESYSAAGYQDVSVCMPVTISADGKIGKIETQCVGKPVINRNASRCKGSCGNVCTFTITQKIRVKVPVTFSVSAKTGDAAIDYPQSADSCEIYQ